MIYESTKGPVEIATMPYSHALNARNKLQRTEPDRVAEIEALNAHLESLQANPPQPQAGAGHNHPPEETPVPAAGSWSAVKVHMDDLLSDVEGCPSVIADQAQADDIARLRGELMDAARLADEARIAEKAPLDEQINEIQTRYNAYIAPLKNKQPGTVSKAVADLNALLAVWLKKLDDDRKAREAEARKLAEEAAAEAIAARKALEPDSSAAAFDGAADLLDEAEALIKDLRRVEKMKPQVKVEGVRAVSLRSKWHAKLIEGQGGIALKHYANREPERVKQFLQVMADEDVARGIRAIPGFDIVEERVV